MPSTCGAFTSTRRLSRLRMLARSIASAASASGDFTVAARLVAASSNTTPTAPKGFMRIAIVVVSLWAIPYVASHRKWRGQFVNLSLAIGKRIEMCTHFVEQRQVQIGQWRGLLKLDVTSAFHAACRAARDQNREILVVMHVGVS